MSGVIRSPRSHVVLLLSLCVAACSKPAPLDATAFVGKWHSSRANAAIRLDANGEWELLGGDGGSRQYGVWQIHENSVIWSIRLDGQTHHDANPVLSFDGKEFRLREPDGSVTSFARLN